MANPDEIPAHDIDSIAETDSSSTTITNEVHTYEAPWPIYSFNFSYQPHYDYRIAVGSLIEDRQNYMQIIQLIPETNRFVVHAQCEHPFPPTKIMWIPDSSSPSSGLFATSSDCLRIWTCGENNRVTLESQLNNNRNSQYCGPLTSFDWNPVDKQIIGTASIDCTCCIWDIHTQTLLKQILTHNKEVNDIGFGHDPNIFASVGSDGSVRRFDLRSLEQCAILYETQDYTPLMRLSWNKIDPNYIAIIVMDSPTVSILDIRQAGMPIVELSGHNRPVNTLSWAPMSECYLCTAADDKQALIWDLRRTTGEIRDPQMMYGAMGEIITLNWSALPSEWVGIAFSNKIQLLRV